MNLDLQKHYCTKQYCMKAHEHMRPRLTISDVHVDDIEINKQKSPLSRVGGAEGR